jgi:hypothetical protein
MKDFSLLSGSFSVPADQLAHDLAIARLVKSADVPAGSTAFCYFGAYIEYLREFEVVIASRGNAAEGGSYVGLSKQKN